MKCCKTPPLALTLSVPYLGSNCLELYDLPADALDELFLSVPYLGSNCLEPRQRVSRISVVIFLSVPYLGSNCLELCTTGAAGTYLSLSVPYLGSNCLELQARDRLGGDVSPFQYPTSGRTAWSLHDG